MYCFLISELSNFPIVNSKMAQTHGFDNVIALIVFNFSEHIVHNVQLLQKLYGKHFKQLIFYSDTMLPDDPNQIVTISYSNSSLADQTFHINYVSIQKGYLTHKIFPHFYHKYRADIEQADGVFYFMDDCAINTSLLSSLSTKQPIVIRPNLITGIVSDWQWIHIYKERMAILTQSGKHHNLYYGMFSDYFYLPKALWTDRLISLFEIFGDYDIFLEIAIPTVLREIEISYDDHKNQVLWNDDRNIVVKPGWLEQQFKQEKVLVVHPVKLADPAQRHLLDFML